MAFYYYFLQKDIGDIKLLFCFKFEEMFFVIDFAHDTFFWLHKLKGRLFYEKNEGTIILFFLTDSYNRPFDIYLNLDPFLDSWLIFLVIVDNSCELNRVLLFFDLHW